MRGESAGFAVFFLFFISFLIIFECNENADAAMEVIYTLDGKDFRDYGVRVSSSQGLIGGLKPKKCWEAQWDDENGSFPDMDCLYFEGRDIVLNAFLTAEGTSDFIAKIEAFCALLYAPGEHLLRVSVAGKSLEYRVRLADAINVEKRFREGKMVATFALKLYEPQPRIPQRTSDEV